MPPTIPNREVVAFRLPSRVLDEVRALAAAEDESQAAILRRLIKTGLQSEPRRIDSTPRGLAR
jgi:hypothetical protein